MLTSCYEQHSILVLFEYRKETKMKVIYKGETRLIADNKVYDALVGKI